MYKTVIIGVGGGRAHGHANAYQYVKRGRVVAVCDLERDPMDEFADKYDVKARYSDYREMFEKEKARPGAGQHAAQRTAGSPGSG